MCTDNDKKRIKDERYEAKTITKDIIVPREEAQGWNIHAKKEYEKQ